MTGPDFPRSGLYPLTDGRRHPGVSVVEAVTRAISGGARVIQYRDKSGDHHKRRAEAGELLELCRRHAVPLIVNDDVQLALDIGADGVHLGRDDIPLGAARARLGVGVVIGISCYDQPQLAEAAQRDGADYVAFGSFYPSSTKPSAVPASIALLEAMRDRIHVPIVAIGGITPDNGAALLAAGADLLAVVHGVFGDPDPRAAAGRYARLFALEEEGEKS